jgi:hypothetical protein
MAKGMWAIYNLLEAELVDKEESKTAKEESSRG